MSAQTIVGQINPTDIYLLLFYGLVAGINIAVLISTFRHYSVTRRLSHLFFLLSHIFILSWMVSLFYGLILRLNFPIDITIANRIGFASMGISATFLPLYLLYEFGSFEKKTLKILLYVYLAFGLLLTTLSFIPNGVVVEYSLIQNRTIYGPARDIFSVLIVAAYLTPMLILIFRMGLLKGIQKFQIRLLLPALLATIILLLGTNLYLPSVLKSSSTSLFGPIIISIYYFVVFYTSFRYRLINIPNIVTQLFNIFLKISFVLGIFSVLNAIDNNDFSIAFLIIVGLFSGQVIGFIDDVTFRFNSTQERSLKLEKLLNKISKELDLQKLCETIEEQGLNIFPKHEVSIILLDEKRKNIKFGTGYKKQLRKLKEILESEVLSQHPVLSREELNKFGNEKNIILKFMQENSIGLLAPLKRENITNGLLLISSLKEEIFSDKDIQLTESLANNSSVAISRALLYMETRNFATELEHKVELRTQELQTANEKLGNLVEELKRLDAAKSEFISIASHQLRTPISIIRGYTTMMTDGDFGNINEEQAMIVNRIQQGAVQLSTIVDDILNASRIEQGRLVITPESFDIVQSISQIVADLQQKAAGKNISVVFKNPPKKGVILSADKGKIYEVIMNIIDNGVNYTQEGGITVSLKEEAKSIMIEVKDTGIGIPKEAQDKIFQRFSRLENAKKVRPDGTGIGLYIAKTIVDAHGGKIWFESIEGKGTTFFIQLLKEVPKESLDRLAVEQKKIQLEHSTTPSIS